jgi:hypothetical protein
MYRNTMASFCYAKSQKKKKKKKRKGVHASQNYGIP